MQVQVEPRTSPRIYSWRDMPSRKRDPREVLRANSAAYGAVAASKPAGVTGDPSTIVTSQTLKCWYRTDTLTNSGSNVVTLTDKSAAGKTLAVTGTAPTINATDGTLSSLQTVAFASGQGLFNNTSISIAPPFTMMFVAKLTTWASTVALFGDLASHGLVCGGSSPLLYQNDGSYSNNQSMTTGTWFLVWAEFTNSTSDRIKVGSNAFTTTPGTNSGNTTMTSVGFNLAGGAGTAVQTIREGCIWGGLITGTERTNVTSYVSAQSASIQV